MIKIPLSNQFEAGFPFKQIKLSVCVVDTAEPLKILDKMRLFMQINE